MSDFDDRLSGFLRGYLRGRQQSGESLKDVLLREVSLNRGSFRSNLGGRVVPAPTEVPEVIIGAGLHGTIYAANRGQTLCFDQQGSRTSIFGQGYRSVFYLNSRNRPEDDYRRPGAPGPLNSIVGGIFQPSEINILEYQSQDDLALAIQINLLNFARVVRAKVVKVGKVAKMADYRYRYQVDFIGGYTLTNRVVIATGLGEEVMPVKPSQRVWGFPEFLRVMGNPGVAKPLQGYKRVAIIGTGDSGKVVAEWFLGLGPQPGFSSAAEDFVERIVWIGQENLTKEDWEACERSRYIGLGRSFPRSGQPNYYYRIQPEPGRAVSVRNGSKSVRVDWVGPKGRKSEKFDLAVFCTGFENRVMDLLPDFEETEVYEAYGVPVARRVSGEEIYMVGPCADLELEEREIDPRIAIPENSAAAFRYADKTAAFAKAVDLQFRFYIPAGVTISFA